MSREGRETSRNVEQQIVAACEQAGPMTLEQIESQSHHLPAIKRLGRENNSTLGFLPEGAYDEAAAEGRLVAAIDSSGMCAAYLLYRTTARYASITHVCVAPQLRGRGLARMLVDHVKQRTRHLDGIRLLCRREYDASGVWPTCGFVAIGERPGRGKSCAPLTVWWLDHGHTHLFSQSEAQALESRVSVVLDANVFFSSQQDDDHESRALLADWLQDTIVLCVTQELPNEINRAHGDCERKRGRAFASTFVQASCTDDAFNAAMRDVQPLFAGKRSTSDQSDLRQLARAIAAGINVFVTFDEELLALADEVERKWNLRIMRPSELIAGMDTVLRQAEYQPARLAGSAIRIRRAQAGDEERVVSTFLANGAGEKKSEFRKRYGAAISSPRESKVWIVQDDAEYHGLVAISSREQQESVVPLIRLREGGLGPTLARCIVGRIITCPTASTSLFTTVSDPCLNEITINALRYYGFEKTEQGWTKVSMPMVLTCPQLCETLKTFAVSNPKHRALCCSLVEMTEAALQSAPDTAALLRVERRLWPLKIVEVSVPTYVIPIQPRWALHLFDEPLANQDLFGSEPGLALNAENAYYRSQRPAMPVSPARVLWYVSKGTGYEGVMHIRACSYVDEVLIDTAAEVFKRFRRLGVYQWPDVLGTAKGHAENRLLGFQFSGTELFCKPVPFSVAARVIKEQDGVKTTFQGPVRVSRESFLRLYVAGAKRNGK